MKLASCLLPAVLLALPLAASAAIYKWTDEHGTTVYSNRMPAAVAKVSNVQVVVEDDEPGAAPKPAATPKPAAAPQTDNGNALQQRVRALEQQVQALQTQPSGYAAPYPPQLPPPTNSYPSPPAGYYPPPDYSPQSYPSDYPPPMYGYGNAYYPYAYPSVVVVAPRRFGRPVQRFDGHRFGVGVLPKPVMPVTHVAHRR